MLSNKDEILNALKEHEAGIRKLKNAFRSRNAGAIQKFIHEANRSSAKLAPKIS